MKKLIITASTYDEAIDKLIKNYRDEALEYFLCEDCDTLEFEYGDCIPYVYKESEDCDYRYQGNGDITFDEFDFSADEVLEVARNIIAEGCSHE